MGTGVPGHWQYAGKAEMQAMTRKSGYPPMSVFVSGWRGAGAGLQTSAIQRFTAPYSARIIVAAKLLLLCTAAHGDLGVIDITGPASESTGVPFETGDTPEDEFTGFKEVIPKEELQRAAGSLAGVIASESGVQFRQSGGLGSFSTISLRGSTAEQVNVYLDGVLLNEAAGGGVNLSLIELLQAERVEVYRGTVPVQLGNSAIGGAVNITSARATDTASTTLLAGFGSFGSSRFSSAYTGPVKGLSDQRLVASFSHRESENNFSFVNDNGTSFNTDDDETQERRNGQTRNTSAFIKTGHRFLNDGRLEHSLQLSRHNQGISDFRNTPQGSATLDTDNLQWRSTFFNTAGEGGWSMRVGSFFGLKDELFDDSESSIGIRRQKVNSDTRVFGGRAFFEKIKGKQSYSFNVRARSETLETFDELLLSNTTTDANRISRQRRVPSFFELFGSQGLFLGNAELATETANNFDIGIEWRSDARFAVDAAVQIALFQSRKENLISRVFNARGVGRSENISQAQSTGLEFVSSFAFANGYSIDANVTVQDTENLSNISGFTGRQLPGEAAVDAALTARWKNNRWKAEYEFNFNADRFYDSPNLLPAADQRLHTVRLSRYWRNWRLDVEVDNLTDQNFEDFNGFPKPGRAGFFSIIYQPDSKELL